MRGLSDTISNDSKLAIKQHKTSDVNSIQKALMLFNFGNAVQKTYVFRKVIDDRRLDVYVYVTKSNKNLILALIVDGSMDLVDSACFSPSGEPSQNIKTVLMDTIQKKSDISVESVHKALNTLQDTKLLIRYAP